MYTHTSVADEMICIEGDYKHPFNPDQLEAKLLRDKIKERITTETTCITKIYDEDSGVARVGHGWAAPNHRACSPTHRTVLKKILFFKKVNAKHSCSFYTLL
jgi:hypothetical protein